MSNRDKIYYYPQSYGSMNGHTPRDVVWGFQHFNGGGMPTYYDRNWVNCNFRQMGNVGGPGTNPSYVYNVYNSSNGPYYPVQNMNIKPSKKGGEKRRFYKNK